MLSMGRVGFGSILYLLVRDARFDRFAAASAEVGTAFSLVMLTTGPIWAKPIWGDRKSTRLNSSHSQISYAVFCLKKKNRSQSHNTLSRRAVLGPFRKRE